MRFGNHWVRSGKRSRYFVIAAATVIVGVAMVMLSRAASSSISLFPNSGAMQGNVAQLGTTAVQFGKAGTCGKRVQNYSYQVPFGNAVWNQPVCNLARYSRSVEFANRFYYFANVNDGTPATQIHNGEIGVGIGLPKPTLTDPEGLSTLFSRNVYYAKDATMQIQVQTSVYASNLDGANQLSNFPNTTIPWNPDWRTGEAGDNEIVVLDQQSGKIWGIAGYKRDLAAVTQCGPFFRERLCAYEVNIGRDLSGNIIDYRTFEGSIGDRGVGISYFASLVTPEEVIAGEIRHAMGVAIPNSSYGPVCSAVQLGTSAESNTCGTAVAPASKFEWAGVTAPPILQEPFKSFYKMDKTIPEGMRFAVDISDGAIEQWIQSRPDLLADSKKAQTARIFARAMRDYGFIIADTSGAGAGVQMAGAVNPDARTKWASVGLDSDDDANLLFGLVTSSNLYVVAPPKLTCSDGTFSYYFCPWTKANY